MAYKVEAFYKPNMKGTGTALQISKTSRGLLFSLAKQNKVAAAGDNAAFDWANSTIFNFDELELGKLSTFIDTWSNPLIGKTPQELKFFHGKSNTPKNITVKLTEYPVGSGKWNYMMQVNEGEKNIGIALSFEDFVLIRALVQNELNRYLIPEGTSQSSIYINTPQGPTVMIRDTYLPPLAVGDIFKQEKKNKEVKYFKIINKFYDLNEDKTVYMVTDQTN